MKQAAPACPKAHATLNLTAPPRVVGPRWNGMTDQDPLSVDAEAESKTVADANEDSKKANLDSMPLPAPVDAEGQSKQDDNGRRWICSRFFCT